MNNNTNNKNNNTNYYITNSPECSNIINIDDIITDIMFGRSPYYIMNEYNTDKNSETDRWNKTILDESHIQPYNPNAQGIMPYSDSIDDKYNLYNLDNNQNKSEVGKKIVEKIVVFLTYQNLGALSICFQTF